MSERAADQGSRERRWRDREGTEWTVSSRGASTGHAAGWILRSETYCFVVHAADPATEPGEGELHSYLDRHRGLADEGPTTARLWTDPRSRMEWEVSGDTGELAFRSGTEVVRSAGGDGEKSVWQMSDHELQDQLDEAESGS
jgi:hypothetical protein